ncbi:glycosyltransferase [Phytopseudomonas dryadis]|uniref:Glycosyltransferase n=1 Tax=Phytopseudomonas dryadis TaxID=2487520 RepID=A0A4Q9QX62_9GAMM|nr:MULTISPECIES: glycosyltransferase [Pseudomonas]TBU88016.1 glycosyltransferase [Pseudomonas dryadis]TBV00997.1 glycosyltransferase [Pseudomonas dryadis]TBV20051.1 glycosyltransferase [Pseudomonas sp. FRB 230]
MSRRLKVLQLQNRYNVNASDLAEQIIKALPAERYEVTTAFLRGRPGEGEPHSCAARSVYFGFSQAATKGLRLRVLWALYKHCREYRYDAVIVHRFKPINMLMLLNRWLRIRACIGVLHGLGEYDRRYRRWEMRRLLTSAWRFVGVSRAVREDLLASDCGLTPANTLQINNAIDIDRAESLQLPADEARARLGLSREQRVIGSIGRLVPVKGHIYLLQAFAQLQHEFPDARLVIIGDGRCRTELEACIAEHIMTARVLLPGTLDDALQYVRAFDVFVMPSLSEGLPLALLEGMSGKCPVLGSDIDSLRPILQDCGGRIFAAADVATLVQRLREVLQLSDQARDAEGLQAYAYLRRAHAIEDFRRRYRDLLDGLLVGVAPS